MDKTRPQAPESAGDSLEPDGTARLHDSGFDSLNNWRSAVSGNLPKWRAGFIVAAVVLLCDLGGGLLAGLGEEVGTGQASGVLAAAEALNTMRLLFYVGGLAYWLYCVYRLHWVIALASGGSHPIIASTAVLCHFIPLYNFYWYFRWTNALANTVNALLPFARIRKHLPGLLILLGFSLAAYLSGALGLAVLFGVGTYLNRAIAATARPTPGPPLERIP